MSLPANAWRGMLGSAMLALTAAFATAAEPVDVELVLAVDVSLSMSPDELELQRRGYAAALTDPAVLAAIAGGRHRRIALTYFEWAGSSSQHVIVPWTILATPADAERIGTAITDARPHSAHRTSISSAIDFGVDMLAQTPYRGAKRVIDISGDGPNNHGPQVEKSRDAALAKGIVINGLPLMTNDGVNSRFNIPDLDHYYADCVIGGAGAFVIPVNSWQQFPEAIRQKLVLELAGAAPVIHASIGVTLPPVVHAATRPKYDCLVGEKRWPGRGYDLDPR